MREKERDCQYDPGEANCRKCYVDVAFLRCLFRGRSCNRAFHAVVANATLILSRFIFFFFYKERYRETERARSLQFVVLDVH